MGLLLEHDEWSRHERNENDSLGTLHSRRNPNASEELPEGVTKDLWLIAQGSRVSQWRDPDASARS